jgi:hypothetical protein
MYTRRVSFVRPYFDVTADSSDEKSSPSPTHPVFRIEGNASGASAGPRQPDSPTTGDDER